jgi:hypothetical protein
MKVRVRRSGLIVHYYGEDEDIEINQPAGAVFEWTYPGKLLAEVADFIDILDYYPRIGKYEVVKAFAGHKIGDIIELYADEAGRHVLRRLVKPCDDSLWSPGRELPKNDRTFLGGQRDEIVDQA